MRCDGTAQWLMRFALRLIVWYYGCWALYICIIIMIILYSDDFLFHSLHHTNPCSQPPIFIYSAAAPHTQDKAHHTDGQTVSICIISAELSSSSSNEVHFMVPSHSYCCVGAIERSKSAKTNIVCGLVRRNVAESVGFLTNSSFFSFFECFLIHRSHHDV